MSSPVPKHPSNLVAAGKKISTVATDVYLDCASAVSQVALEHGANSTLDVFHRPTGPVGLRSCLQVLRDPDELVLLSSFLLLIMKIEPRTIPYRTC